MIDLHTHSTFSDGELIPFELARRAEVLGCRYLAITDHVDFSSLDFVIPRIVEAARRLNEGRRLTVLPGCELTHIPPVQIAEAAEAARKLGARIIVVHGETPVEPVIPGTNRAALDADIDILAHPGFITEKEAARAAKRGILLELTARGGHNITNGHVARVAQKTGAQLVVNTDAHSPRDLISLDFAKKIAVGAGMDATGCRRMAGRVEAWLKSRL